jgi:branched-chain amino acid transport system permease protein
MTRAPLVAALVLILGAALLPLGLQPYGIYLLSLWAVYSMAAVGLNLTLGYAGQVSLAQAAFVGLGAYMTAVLGAYGVPFAVLVALSAGVAVVVGWCLGYPALRVQHHYLAFVTLAFGTLIWLVLRNEEWLTGGIGGISNIARPALFRTATAYNALCMGALAGVVCGVWWLLRSPWGRAFTALRENAIRAASLGVDVRGYTLSAFAIGAGLGGVAGAFYAPLVQYIEPSPFSMTFSLNLLLMVIVGGSGTFLGPLVGALVAVLLPEWLRFLQDYYLILYATLVMVLLVFCPSGLLGLAERIAALWRPAAKPAAAAP